MKNVLVGSENPVKIETVRKGFSNFFPDEKFNVEGIAVSSDVRDQPIGEEETMQGALNRIKNLKHLKADYYVGIEGGVDLDGEEIGAYAWIVVESIEGVLGKGKTGKYYLPKLVKEKLNEGLELGKAIDSVYGVNNSKHTSGAVGILTKNLINRTEFYYQAMIFALIHLDVE